MLPKDASGQGASGCGGRLSLLPDRILVRVLCHLKAWEAVRTCLLSKRWRGLWTSAPRLDIRQPCGCGEDDEQRRAEAFAAFVKHLILRRRPLLPLDALRLCWSHAVLDGDANTWIAHAVRHGAEEIELSGAHHADCPSPDYLSFVPADTTIDMHLKIVKLVHVGLDDTTLTKLCSSLQDLELKDCSVEGKEIDSTSLKRLNMISCRFVDGFRVHCPNLESLCCIRPFGYVPRIQKMEHLVAVTIVLDDICLRNDRQWPQEEDEFDDDGDFFAHADSEDSDDNSIAHSAAEESGGSNQYESDDDGDFFVHAGYEDSDENSTPHSASEEAGGSNHNDSDDNSNYYDSDWSRPSDDEGDDRIVCYSEIADEHQKKWHKYLINGNKRSAGGPIYVCSENSNFGGTGMLCSLSNVQTLDLLAHPGEIVLTRELNSCLDFKNLKTLSLGEWCMTPQLDALATILNHSPNLENLFLHLDLAFNSRVGINPHGSSFSCANLKRVMITCSNCDVMVHRLAEFFRVNGIRSEKIFVLRTSSSDSTKGDAVSPAKRKAGNEAETRGAKQRKQGN